MSNEELSQRITALELVIASLRNGSSIPFDIGAAFESRMSGGATIQGTNGSIYSKAVNEAGSATYSVAKVPDGSAPAIIGGTQVYIPFYV